jgi:hypothetical protein
VLNITVVLSGEYHSTFLYLELHSWQVLWRKKSYENTKWKLWTVHQGNFLEELTFEVSFEGLEINAMFIRGGGDRQFHLLYLLPTLWYALFMLLYVCYLTETSIILWSICYFHSNYTNTWGKEAEWSKMTHHGHRANKWGGDGMWVQAGLRLQSLQL